MQNLKLKKVMATVMAATLVMGMSLTALADDPVTSGGTDGAGISEGHVEKKVVNVVLPTVASDTTPFAYTMDPERLITETSAAKYAEGTTFPAADSDTGVYFLTAEKTYANTSNTLQAINKSSCAITLTVKVKAEQKTAKDIALATSATTLTAEASGVTSPLLYLGLNVGKDTKVVSATEQTVTKTIAGTPGNFETAVSGGSYVYQVKSDATSWKAVNISMTGKVGNAAIATDTTAPTVKVTWSYAEADADATPDTEDAVDYSDAPVVVDAAPAIATTEYTMTSGEAVEVTVNLGSGDLAATGISSITFTKNGAERTLDAANYSLSGTTLTFSADYVDALISGGISRTHTITFNDDAETAIEVTLAAE